MIKKISVARADDKGPGWARVQITGSGLPGQGLTLRIADGSTCLSDSGFQAGQHIITPQEFEYLGDSALTLLLGPHIVQHLDRANYTFSLLCDGQEHSKKVVSWPITFTPTTEVPIPRRTGVTIERQPVKTEGGLAPEAGTGASDAPAEAVIPPPARPLEAPRPVHDVPQSGGSAGKAIGLIAGAVLIAAAIAAGAWWLYKNNTSTPAETPLAATPETVTPAPDSASTLTPQQQAEAFLATNPSAQDMSARAGEFLAQGHLDVAVLLYRRAADGGETAALLQLGRIYDPFSDLGNSTLKRPQVAYNFYRKAMLAGDAGAKEAINALRKWATESADAGNADAAQLLRLIQIEMGAS